MQEREISGRESTQLCEPANRRGFSPAGKIAVPRCDCCGALVPLTSPAACVNDIASCMVCGHRNGLAEQVESQTCIEPNI